MEKFDKGINPRCRRQRRMAGARERPGPAVLFRRLFPGVAVGLGFRLEPQVAPLLALARAVAKNLLLAGEVLRRAADPPRAVPSRGLPSEIRVDEMRPRERRENRAAPGDDGGD